jgi:hypothetical protein
MRRDPATPPLLDTIKTFSLEGGGTRVRMRLKKDYQEEKDLIYEGNLIAREKLFNE